MDYWEMDSVGTTVRARRINVLLLFLIWPCVHCAAWVCGRCSKGVLRFKDVWDDVRDTVVCETSRASLQFSCAHE